MKAKAHAKINLALDVLDKSGAYHDINSVMQQIELHDTLTFEESGAVEVISPFQEDIVFRTITKLKDLFRLSNGISVTIEKNIPSAVGLGGGSSDAACALLVLNDLWGLGLKKEELANIASDIGSDVPFFLRNSPCFVSGRGEVLESVKLPKANLVLVIPPYRIATKDAYSSLDKMDYAKTFSSNKMRSVASLKELASFLHNDFICIQKEEVRKIIKDLKDQGALNASITGKGPAVFGLFETESDAEDAFIALRQDHNLVFRTVTR